MLTRVLCTAAERRDQPASGGELGASILLAPATARFAGEIPFPAWRATTDAIDHVASFGIFFLVLPTGVELTPEVPWRSSRSALAVALGGRERRAALAVGVGLRARGAVEIVVNGIAQRAGLFAQSDETSAVVTRLFSAMMLMAAITTLVTPIALRRLLGGRKK